jgi:putative endonuclease
MSASEKTSGCWFYILRCADSSCYAGASRSDDLETRISQHDQGLFGGYTAKRHPLKNCETPPSS